MNGERSLVVVLPIWEVSVDVHPPERPFEALPL
jgi:hypothetical protein